MGGGRAGGGGGGGNHPRVNLWVMFKPDVVQNLLSWLLAPSVSARAKRLRRLG